MYKGSLNWLLSYLSLFLRPLPECRFWKIAYFAATAKVRKTTAVPKCQLLYFGKYHLKKELAGNCMVYRKV